MQDPYTPVLWLSLGLVSCGYALIAKSGAHSCSSFGTHASRSVTREIVKTTILTQFLLLSSILIA